MTELLLILAVIFVGYVLFGIPKEAQATTTSPIPPVKTDKPVRVEAVKPVTTQALSKTEKAPASRPKTARAKNPKPASTNKPKLDQAKPAGVSQHTGKPGLKDPKTGNLATSYSNYRFTKRWIKEALVAEGLLDKVYKNDELTADIETKIKNAIGKLEAIKKYRS
jgi:predicted component of type VI protein secretion system